MPDFATHDRNALKAALTEVLHENRDWLRELVQEALLEVASAEAHLEEDLRAAQADAVGPYPLPHGRA